MPLSVFLAVLAAAVLHASWNAMVKGTDDKFLSVTAVMVGSIPLSLAALCFVPFPKSEAWPYLLTSIFLHLGYQTFLIFAYRVGDLTQVYPIARGAAPMIVAVVSATVLGLAMSPLQLLAITVVATGIMSIAFTNRKRSATNASATLMALGTACFIASYSLVDGLGARAAGTGVGFYAVSSTLNGLLLMAIMEWLKPGMLRRVAAEGRTVAVVGGNISFVAYAIVTWAFTQTSIASVTALRETSIIFAVAIGVFVLKERFTTAKAIAIAITVAGAILLRLSG